MLSVAARAQVFEPRAVNPVPRASPIPAIRPAAPPQVVPETAPPPLPAPTGLGAGSYNITGVTVEGATAYPVTRIQGLMKSAIGASVTQRQIEDARRSVLLLYRNDGYPFVAVDVRLDQKGLLHATVTEGYIVDVKLSGDIGPVGSLVLRFLDHLLNERPLSESSLERWLLLAQSIPGLQIQPVLQRSVRDPGALTLVARVTHSVFSGNIAADNRASPTNGPNEALLTVGVNSLTSFGERTEASLYWAGATGKQLFGQADEQFFIGGSGLTVRLYGGAGDTTPCCDLAQIGYDGKTTVFGAQLSYPLLLSRQQQLYLRGDLDALNSDTYEQSILAAQDNVRAARVEADYTLADTFLGTSFDAQNSLMVKLSRGFFAFGATPNDAVNAGRLGEDHGFFKVNAEFSRDQTLMTFPKGERISVYGLAAGQYSPNVLPNSEQFYLGGLRYTRGYYSGEVVGDSALALTGELRYSFSDIAEAFGTSFTLSPQFYGFYDWGETWQNQTTDLNQILRSYGMGLRMGITPYARLELEVLQRVTRQVGGQFTQPLPADAFYWRFVSFF
jgi:hemolysin activation/secretion protein